jgi:60 kDa SS-A/Ro ribonucleoprotein
MAKFNPKAKSVERKEDLSDLKNATRNAEGGLAFTVSPELELYLRSASCMFGEPKFYDPDASGNEEIFALINKVSKTNPEFPLKLAMYCRNEMYLRSLPVALLVGSCAHAKSKKYVRRYTPFIINRPDELTETIALYKIRNGDIGDAKKGGMLCNPLKRGLADVTHKFNEYSFAKYDRDGEVKLKDVFRIVHPKPRNPAEAKLFKKIVNRTLAIPETWETKISVEGSTKETWEEILPKMGFMARLRNLRNFLQKGVDITDVVLMLEDEEQVAKSKQFPHRFLSAYKEIEVCSDAVRAQDRNKLLNALATAMEYSVANVPRMPGTSFVMTDNSGSMQSPMSEKSKITLCECGNTLGAMAIHLSQDAIVGCFGETFAVVPITKHDSILTNAKRLINTHVGHSTNAYKGMEWLLKSKTKVDRILIFSDMQCYNENDSDYSFGYGRNDYYSLYTLFKQYREKINPKVVLYSFDLSGYGTSQFPEKMKNVALIGGFSDKVFNFIDLFERKESVLKTINGLSTDDYAKREKSDE